MATVGLNLHRILMGSSTEKVTGAVLQYEAVERRKLSISGTLRRFPSLRYSRRLGERQTGNSWLWPEMPETGDWTIDIWNDWKCDEHNLANNRVSLQ